jgi:hypothetical protein
MSDETSNNGMSGWAWYQLGQANAEHRASVQRTVNAVFGRRQPSVDVNAVLAQNQALAQEVRQLREQLADYEHNYRDLKKWADDASKRLIAYRSAQSG